MPTTRPDPDPRRKCLVEALRHLSRRLQSLREMQTKLARRHDPQVVEATIADLQRLGYIDDAKFAAAKAQSAMENRHHGRRRAMSELMRSGVPADVADRAIAQVYAETDSTAVARQLAVKHAPRLRKLDPQTARRRLAGMLQRRGFDYEAIKPVIDEVLGQTDE